MAVLLRTCPLLCRNNQRSEGRAAIFMFMSKNQYDLYNKWSLAHKKISSNNFEEIFPYKSVL